MAVADRREGLDAEEECAQPVPAHAQLTLAAQASEPAEQVGPGEHRVHREVPRRHEAEEARPGDGEQRVVPVQIAERRKAQPAGREAAVAVEQALLVRPADDGAEAKVLRFVEGGLRAATDGAGGESGSRRSESVIEAEASVGDACVKRRNGRTLEAGLAWPNPFDEHPSLLAPFRRTPAPPGSSCRRPPSPPPRPTCSGSG